MKINEIGSSVVYASLKGIIYRVERIMEAEKKKRWGEKGKKIGKKKV